MFGRLLAIFLITPVIELALLIKVGEVIGFAPTIGLIVVTGLAGSYLARREGLSVWRRFHERLHAGDLPGRELVDGMIILVSGALLITPGVLTDVVGFLGLLPITRRYLRQYINKRIRRAVERGNVRLTFGGIRSYGTEFDATHYERSGKRNEGPAQDGEISWEGQGREKPEHGVE
ncbi:MAG: FxsA family protein [Rhodothermales bacterium]